MIDRGAVAEYDKYWQSFTPCALETREIRTGLWRKARVIKASPTEGPDCESYDAVVAGGGPAGILLGSILARQGFRVLLLEKNTRLHCGSTWNLSRPEFEDLKKTGTLAAAEWEGLVEGEFTEGVSRFYDDSASPAIQREFRWDEILNISINEADFFRLLAATPGLEVRMGCRASLALISPSAAYVECGDAGLMVRGRLFIDATGWRSPLAALVNEGLQTESVYNMFGIHTSKKLPRLMGGAGRPLGLICATYENEINTGAGMVQPILERFTNFVPGRVDGGDIVYYFSRTARPAPILPLVDEMLSRISPVLEGFTEDVVDRTYFGHGPGYYYPGPFAGSGIQTSVGDRVYLAGAAGLQYSGLTGCVFGALARNAAGLGMALARNLRRNRLSFGDLCAVDIDPRERISMAIGGLFGGSMALGVDEKRGTVNRDWIMFSDMLGGLDPRLKNESLRDKITLVTLNRLVAICAGKPKVIEAVLRNNRGHAGIVVWTFISSYARLLWQELKRLILRRKYKYAAGSGMGMARLPLYAVNVTRFWTGARGLNGAEPTNKGAERK